jgi:hypothetical protein
VFLSIVGVAIVLGALRFRSRNVLLAAGAVLATIVTAFVAPGLTARAGVPTIAQTVWLAAAVAAEIVLLAVFIRRVAPHGERAVVLTVLGIVAAHFLPMAPAFGPSMILLGLLCAANVLLAARLTDYSLRSVSCVQRHRDLTHVVGRVESCLRADSHGRLAGGRRALQHLLRCRE